MAAISWLAMIVLQVVGRVFFGKKIALKFSKMITLYKILFDSANLFRR